MKKHPLVSCATLLLWSLSTQAQPNPQAAPVETVQARIARVEQGLSTRVVVKGSANRTMNLTDRMAFHQVPAVSIALINDGRIEWARAYGLADVAGRWPATTSTLFQAASISKSVSAMGALHLVEQGKLVLDGDANRQLSSWKIPHNAFTRREAVSLRMLLNHSAGTTVHGYNGYAPGQPLPTLLQVLDGVAPANSAPVRVDAVPASAWRYSGGGYSIVQLMMMQASGQPFDHCMKAAVLDPLGMTQSTFAAPLPASMRARAATAYDGDGKSVAGSWHVYPESAAAGLWTTPSDLARLVIEVQRAQAGQSDKVVSRRMASTMLTRGLGEYGLGFFVEDLGDRISFSHSGGTEGFRAQFYGYTRTGQGAVVMTNSDNGAALIDEILSSIAAEYGWPEFGVIEKVAIAGDAANNRQLAGEYRLLDRPARIVADGERLYFQSDLFGARRMELFPESKTAFFMTAQDMAIRFERSKDGAIDGFSLVRGANSYPATRAR
ncbi:serine hydrolase domain-containing protein [Lysobacter capsici]|uniref:serine hydrolase domain-containing protein n=1 Tax=Lysobacter capsici TaxID=435897 RepID=UPI00207A8D4C|nr:serine hydrolase domain-containing protein [Lysobacter capsici]